MRSTIHKFVFIIWSINYIVRSIEIWSNSCTIQHYLTYAASILLMHYRIMMININCDIILWIVMVYSSFQRDWLRRDFNVIGFGLIGWLAPSSIPAIAGKSLTGLFFDSIGTELAHFPSPPALTSPFWLVFFITHLFCFFHFFF